MGKKDVIIIGAGAAGLMCAIEAGKRGRNVLVLDHNKKVGEKIRISGGGRCNFTNLNTSAAHFISQNPHFGKSALSRYTPSDFIELVKKYNIGYHEKKSGQLFCDGTAENIVQMLLSECQKANVEIRTGSHITDVEKRNEFLVSTSGQVFSAGSLVIASGGLSIKKTGASNFGIRIAKQFGIKINPIKPGLVPLEIKSSEFDDFRKLSGVSVDAEVRLGKISFRENILFTHYGLSGPAILQVSSYWEPGEILQIDLLPENNILKIMQDHRQSKKSVSWMLSQFLPSRFVSIFLERCNFERYIRQFSSSDLQKLCSMLKDWKIAPSGTKGYEYAEVTVGGIDNRELSSRTMQSKKMSGLYFIGEVVDMTGWLGGYNFQWAWSSGWAAGQTV